MKKLALGPDQMAAILGSESGLAGISGTSGDIRDMDEAAARGDKRFRLALDVFVYAIRHYLGAFLIQLGGVDAITFSGGIGENSKEIRAAVLRDLSNFGIAMDTARNDSVKGEGIISTDQSAVRVFIVPANEEIVVARETVAVVVRSREAAQTITGNRVLTRQ